jgi:NOL1/NOP2/fmu family ribosome biogenesis protein
LLNLLSDNQFEEIKTRCELFYGIDQKCWDSYLLLERKAALWIININMYEELNECSFDTAGLRIFSGDKAPYKPTFAFFTFFNDKISKGYLEFDDENTNRFIHREDIVLDKEVKGYYGVKNRGFFVGVGLGRGKNLLSQVPKKIGNQITRI